LFVTVSFSFLLISFRLARILTNYRPHGQSFLAGTGSFIVIPKITHLLTPVNFVCVWKKKRRKNSRPRRELTPLTHPVISQDTGAKKNNKDK
jgi:hypothetical protein